jgi:Ala-tRNA(Pro) deacylase
MPLSERLRSFLDSHQAEFTLTTHAKAFTAREVANAEHLPPREVAKTVVIFGDGAYHMIVVPASKLADLYEVRSALGLSQARLATENELGILFPDCELGAMPPLGPLYGLTVYLDNNLLGQDMIGFNAGTHCDMIHMRTAEFQRLAQPRVVALAREPVAAHGW